MRGSPPAQLAVLAAAFALAAGAGFVAGRWSAPSRVPASTHTETRTGSREPADFRENPGVSSAPRTVTQDGAAGVSAGGNSATSRRVLQPITASELRATIKQLERSNFSGVNAIRSYADLQERILASDVDGLARELLSGQSSGPDHSMMFLIMNAFAEKNPVAAWDFALKIPNHQLRSGALMAAMNSLITKNPDQAIAKLNAIEDPNLRQSMQATAISGLATKDPRKALQMVQGEGGDDMNLVTMVFARWARVNAGEARSALAELSGRRLEAARTGLVQILAQTDPAGAWKLVAEQPASSNRGDPRVSVLDAWARTDPRAALSAAMQISQPTNRGEAISSVMRGWANSSFDDAFSFAKGISNAGDRADALAAMTQTRVTKPAELFQAILDTVPPGDKFQNAVASLLSTWGRDDPHSAAAAATRLPPGRALTSAVGQIASSWASKTTNTTEVLDWARTLPEGDVRRNAVQSVVRHWAETDPVAAAAALKRLTPQEREGALSQITQAWSERDPKAAFEWAAGFSDDKERREAAQSVVQAWVRNDPESAAAAIQRLPAEDRGSVTEGLVREWARQDTNAAAKWVGRLRADGVKDRALWALSGQMIDEDASTAIAWAGQIGDAKLRDRQVESLARRWMRLDPAAAREWITRSTLAPELKQRVLR